jgi:hypothetical protein
VCDALTRPTRCRRISRTNAAAAVPRFPVHDRFQFGNHVVTAPAHPEPHAGTAVLERDEIAEDATGNVAARRKGGRIRWFSANI